MSSLIVKVVKVFNIEKHPNADRLSIVTVENENGWNCIVGLDQYKVGDLVVYIPPDAIIPEKLIEKHNLEYLKSDGRTKSVKLRGILSQGLILDVPDKKFKEGDDVAEFLGITKYEQPEPSYAVSNGGKTTSKKKLNPMFDKYTDIENIKNYGLAFKDGEDVVITEKIHGSNGRWGKLPIHCDNNTPLLERIKYFFNKYVLKKDFEYVYGSHNVQLTSETQGKTYLGNNVWNKIAKKYKLENVLLNNMIIYGEVYGAGIQDLTYGLTDIELAVFDIKYNGKYMDWFAVKNFCDLANIPLVPTLHVGAFSKSVLEECTSGKSKLCETQIREGCVVKPLVEKNDPFVGRKILKSISPDYLSRKGGTEYK